MNSEENVWDKIVKLICGIFLLIIFATALVSCPERSGPDEDYYYRRD